MASYTITSPSGRSYTVDGPEDLGPEDEKEIYARIAASEKNIVEDTGQGPLATFGNAVVQGAAQTGTGVLGGLGAIQNLVVPGRSSLSDIADSMQSTVNRNFPTNPANPISAGTGSAVGQAIGLLGTMPVARVLGAGAGAMAKIGLGTAGLMGAQQGEQAADEFGVTDPLKRAGMVAGFGGAEVLSESLGGFGTTKYAKSLLRDVPSALTGKAESALTRGVKTALEEAAEEPVAGELQDITTAFFSEDPNAPDPFSLEAIPRRVAEFGYGLAGGAVFGGAQALQNRKGVMNGEVLEYRRAVAEKRKDGKVIPEELDRVNELDIKAADYLRENGLDDAMQNAAIADHLLSLDKRKEKVKQAAQNAAANDSPETAAVLMEDILQQLDAESKDDAELTVLDEEARQEAVKLDAAKAAVEEAAKAKPGVEAPASAPPPPVLPASVAEAQTEAVPPPVVDSSVVETPAPRERAQEKKQRLATLDAAVLGGADDTTLRAITLADALANIYYDFVEQIKGETYDAESPEMRVAGALSSAVNFIRNRVQAKGSYSKEDADEFLDQYSTQADIIKQVANSLSENQRALLFNSDFATLQNTELGSLAEDPTSQSEPEVVEPEPETFLAENGPRSLATTVSKQQGPLPRNEVINRALDSIPSTVLSRDKVRAVLESIYEGPNPTSIYITKSRAKGAIYDIFKGVAEQMGLDPGLWSLQHTLDSLAEGGAAAHPDYRIGVEAALKDTQAIAEALGLASPAPAANAQLTDKVQELPEPVALVPVESPNTIATGSAPTINLRGRQVPVAPHDPAIKAGPVDVYAFGARNQAILLPKGYPIPSFTNAREAEDALDQYLTELETKYGGFGPVNNAPVSSSTGFFADLPDPDHPLSDSELFKLRALYVARDGFYDSERTSDVANVVSSIQGTTLPPEQVQRLVEELYDSEDSSARLFGKKPLTPKENQDRISSIYNTIAQRLKLPSDFWSLEETLDILSGRIKTDRVNFHDQVAAALKDTQAIAKAIGLSGAEEMKQAADAPTFALPPAAAEEAPSQTEPEAPETQQLRDLISAKVPKENQKAWTPEVIAAANTYYLTGDEAPLQAATNSLQRKIIFSFKGSQDIRRVAPVFSKPAAQTQKQAPAPEVRERVTIPKQEGKIYPSEQVLEGATVAEGKRPGKKGVFNSRTQNLINADGTERPLFSNNAKTTATQLAAGSTVLVPPSIEEVNPQILTEPVGKGWRKVTGVTMPLEGGRTMVVRDEATARQAFAFDKESRAKSQAAAATEAKKAKTVAKKLAPIDELPVAPDESARMEAARAPLLETVDRMFPNFGSAKADIFAAAFYHHRGNLRIAHLVQDLHKGSNEKAAATIEDATMARRVLAWKPEFNTLPAAARYGRVGVKIPEQEGKTQGLVGNEVAEADPDKRAATDTGDAPVVAQPQASPSQVGRMGERAPLSEKVPETDTNHQVEAELITRGMSPSAIERASKDQVFFEGLQKIHRALAEAAKLPNSRLPINELVDLVKKENPDTSKLPALVRNAIKLLETNAFKKLPSTYPSENVADRMAEAQALGLKEGDPASIQTALENIANDVTRSYHPHLRYVARFLLKQKAALDSIKGVDYRLLGPEYKNFAGVYNAVSHTISFNMENEWGNVNLGQILVHEVGHAITLYKVDAPQTEEDKKFVKEIETLRNRVRDYLTNVRPDLYDEARFDYALSDNNEFVTGVLSDPVFVEMLSQLPVGLNAGEKVTPYRNLFMKIIRDVWNRLLGRTVQAGSPLEQAMNSVFNLASTPWTMPTVENLLSWFGEAKNETPAWLGAFRSTAGTNRNARTSMPLFSKQDTSGYEASGSLFGGGRKSKFIQNAQNEFHALKTKASVEEHIMTRDIKSAANKDYGHKNVPWDTIATAIGNNENRIDPAYREQVKQAHTAAVRAAAGVYTGARNTARANPDPAQAALLTAQAATAYLAAKKAADTQMETDLAAAQQAFIARVKQEQQAALAKLAPATRAAVIEARDKIDALQERLIQSGFLSGKLIPIVDASKGLYLHRSYQIHTDGENYQKWILGSSIEATRIRNKAISLLEQQTIAYDAIKEMRADPTLTKAAAIQKATAALDPRRVEAALHDLLAVSSNDVMGALQGSVGGKPSTILMKRGDIHPVIQELFGVVKDPLLNVAKTHAMISAYIGGQQMMRNIVQNGVNAGFIYTDVTKAPDLVPLAEDTPDNKRKSPALFQKDAQGELTTPYYGSPLLRDALKDLAPKARAQGAWAAIYDKFRALTGYSMAAKTVFSVQATVRDFLSNIVLGTIHGHLPFVPGGIKWSHIKDSLSVNARETGFDKFLEYVLSGVRGKNAPPILDHKKLDKYVGRLVELRVLGDTVYEGTINELLTERSKKHQLRGEQINSFMTAVSRGLTKTVEFASAIRALSDNIPKILFFENELSRLKSYYPNWTQEQLEMRAAEKVRMTTPTYSETSEGVKWFRQQPVISPFVTFSAEIVRITHGTYKLAAQEIKSKVPAEKARGVARAASMTAMLTVVPSLMAAAAQALRDPDKDKDLQTDKINEALPRFVADWQKQNQLLWLGREGNVHSYLDVGYLLPFDLISGPINSAFTELVTNSDNETAIERVAAATGAVAERLSKPFKQQLVFGNVMDIVYNKRSAEQDQPLYDAQLDSWATKAIKSLEHIYFGSLEPGVFRTLRLMSKDGEVDSTGRSYSLENEAKSLGGIKVMGQDIERRLLVLSNKTNAVLSDATQIASMPITSLGTVSDSDLFSAVGRMQDARKKTLREARKDYLAALALGMDQATAISQMKQSTLSNDDVAQVVQNIFLRHQLSKETLTKAALAGKKIRQDRLAIYREAFNAYPATQPLIND